MKTGRIHYVTSSYRSHFRTARAYYRALAKSYEMVDDPADADIVVLHCAPSFYEEIVERAPIILKRYVVGYAVWEADVLPQTYVNGLRYVSEIWTCSNYCYRAFRRSHSNVVVIPHVVERDLTCCGSDRNWAKKAIEYDPTRTYFLSLGDVSNKRKNLSALLEFFRQHGQAAPRSRLIVRGEMDERSLPSQVVLVRGELSDQQINALYEISSAYVSPHHGEGWGLTLSDAMIFNKPVIATRYSGNLEYMNEENSILIDCKEEFIHKEDEHGPFTRDMKWAYTDQQKFNDLMMCFYERLVRNSSSDRRRPVSEILEKYGSSMISAKLTARVEELMRIVR